MTAGDVYQAALALLFEDEQNAGEYKALAAPFLNLLLPEVWETNNSLRLARGKEPLAQIPTVTGLEERLPLEEELARTALPYGLAAKFVYDDNNMNKVAYFHDLYVGAVNQFAAMTAQPIEDVY